MQVGDSFDYRTNGLDCGYRFKVTSVPAEASPRTFGIEYVRRYGGRCSTTVDDPTAARDVQFVWKVPAGVPGLDGVRVLLTNEPAGEGTYRVHPGWAWVIDVPAGMRLIQDGTRILEPAADAPANAPRIVLVLLDAATGSLLGINPETGGELGRQVTSAEVGALFDQIMASIRRVDGPASPPEPVSLRYNRLDISGAATAAGSYAFLKSAGDAASAIGNFGASAGGSVELRINSTDATGASRAAFFDTVQVGDSFDYRTNGLDCGFRFKVTSIAATASPRVFGVDYVRRYGGRCGGPDDDPGDARDVHFLWRVPAGIPGPDGVQVLLRNEPAGEGTYRVHPGWAWVIDVPAGMQVIQDGTRILEPAADAPADAPRVLIILLDAATGSALSINPATGRVVERSITSQEVGALFDQIMASLRRVE